MKSDGPYAADFGPFHGRVWLNTAHQGALPKASVEAALAALDQDLDAVLAAAYSVSVFTGNGDGTFGAGATYASGISSSSEPYFVALADVNGDGHPDIVAANDNDGTLSLLTNKGDGTFEDATERLGFGGDRDWPTSAAFADAAPKVCVTCATSRTVVSG